MLTRLFLLVSITLLFATAAYTQGTPAATDKPATAAPAATPTPAPAGDTTKKPPIFRPNKDQIEQVQKILKTKKLYNGDADGKYNDETRAGIKSFQKDNGLKETGTLNRATLEKFGVELTDKQKEIPVSPGSFASPTSDSSGTKPSTSSTTKPSTTSTATTTSAASDGPKRPAPFSAEKDQIAALQKVLKDAKLFTGEANGERSDELKEAVKKYQEANGLKATGGINAATLQKAGITLTEKQKTQVAAQAAYDAAKKN